MQILIIGSGGREHALAWKCAQDINVERMFMWHLAMLEQH